MGLVIVASDALVRKFGVVLARKFGVDALYVGTAVDSPGRVETGLRRFCVELVEIFEIDFICGEAIFGLIFHRGRGSIRTLGSPFPWSRFGATCSREGGLVILGLSLSKGDSVSERNPKLDSLLAPTVFADGGAIGVYFGTGIPLWGRLGVYGSFVKGGSATELVGLLALVDTEKTRSELVMLPSPLGRF